MKIKHLSIRNIASIERGDIDFENGLTDPLSNSPASLFLITGDTGAGKSVILDCISMCLYGTTPRVEGVNGVKKNKFSTTDGSELSVTDIEQYTRLGISAKDDCFARLTFEGNDGVNYVSTFALGMTTHRNFAAPKWTLKVGNETILEKKKNVAPVIREAVGLSYEQFSRMAMLAQGQFASFLTGGKEERERILEQLTSTEHFSRYGAAIDRIYKRNKKEKDLLENSLATEKAHILNDEEEALLRSQKVKEDSALERSRSLLDNINERLRLDRDLTRTAEEILKNQSVLKEIEEQRDSEDFSNRRQLLSAWDATSSPRTILLRRLESEKDLRRFCGSLDEAVDEFALYLRLLELRRASTDKGRKELHALEDKLKSKEDFKAIAESAELFSERLQRFATLCEELKLTRRDVSEERSILASSEKSLAAAAQDLEVKRSNVDAILSQLKKKHNLLLELTGEKGLKGLRNLLSDLSADKAALESLSKDIVSLDEDIEASVRLHNEIGGIDRLLNEQESELTSLKQSLDKASEESRMADQRYATMHLSVEKGYCDMRRRLRDEHAEVCPLCGSSIDNPDHWASDDELFSSILSPLQVERELKTQKLAACQKNFDSLNSEISSVKGQKSALVSQYGKLSGQIAKAGKNIVDNLNRLGFSSSSPVTENIGSVSSSASSESPIVSDSPQDLVTPEMRTAISVRLGEIDTEIVKLTEAISKADAVNEEILKINQLKTTADSAKEEALKIHHSIDSVCESSRHKIVGCYDRIASLIASLRSLKVNLYPISKSFDSDWQYHPLVTSDNLKKDSEEYHSLVAEVNNRSESLDKLIELTASISEQVDQVASILPAGTDKRIALAMESMVSDGDQTMSPSDTDFRKGWTELYAAIKGLIRNISEARSAIADANDSLKLFYEESGLNEEYLVGLLNSESLIPDIRKAVEKSDSELAIAKRNLDSGQAMLKSIKESLQSLPPIITLSDGSFSIGPLSSDLLSDNETGSQGNTPSHDEEGVSLPDLSELKTALEKDIEERLRSLGSLNSRLADNETLRKNFELLIAKVEAQRATFYKWEKLYRYFGGNRFRTLVQSYILKPLLRNANLYLERITDHYTLTCSDENEQLSILVLDRYNKNQIRSATVLSGGERFMISLALSLALSALNKADMNVDILFIDEGFGTLDAATLNAVIDTLRRLPEIAGQNGRRVGVISHREELADEIDVKIDVVKCGEGRSRIEIR